MAGGRRVPGGREVVLFWFMVYEWTEGAVIGPLPVSGVRAGRRPLDTVTAPLPLPIVTPAIIACGFGAGDEVRLRSTRLSGIQCAK